MNLPVKCITCALKLKLALLLNKGRYVARLELLSITHNITQPEVLSGRLHRQPFELGRSPIGHEIPLQQLPKMTICTVGSILLVVPTRVCCVEPVQQSNLSL